MPRPEINDYIIYKIICNDENIIDCYVGSTANFNKRKNNHKVNCNTNNSMSHYKVYQTIRENGGWENWSMIPIAEYKQISLVESKIKEEEYRVNLEAKLNSKAAYKSKEESIQNQRKNNKNYYQANQEKMKERYKLYYQENQEKIKERGREYGKTYYQENKEKMKEKARLNYHLNKEKLNVE